MDYIEKIDKFIKTLEKRENINIMVKNITKNSMLYSYRENNVFISASIIKVPIMLAIFNYMLNNNISLESYIKIKDDDVLYDSKYLKKGIYNRGT